MPSFRHSSQPATSAGGSKISIVRMWEQEAVR